MSRRRIGILGLGRSGRAAAKLALAQGASVFASDSGDSSELRAAADEIRAAGGTVQLGGHGIDALSDCDLLVLSPGIPPDAPPLRDARVRAVPLISEIEYAFQNLRAPVIAVTGTNGKSTTTALISHLLRESGIDAPAAGNIGVPLSEVALGERESAAAPAKETLDPTAADRPATRNQQTGTGNQQPGTGNGEPGTGNREPDTGTPPAWVVVEVSSFQLATVDTFAPRIGVVTNLAADHLERYASIEAYYADKARLFRNAASSSVWVLNADDAAALALPGAAPGERLFFRTSAELSEHERGGFLRQDGMLVLRRGPGDRGRGASPLAPASPRGAEVGVRAASAPREEGLEDVELMEVADLEILGAHNHENVLAAAIAAYAAGATDAGIAAGLRTFPGLEHRLEKVLERGGVLWINDSKATNVGSTVVALRSMTRPTVLLLGGRHKGGSYSALLPELRRHVRHVIAFGEAAPLIARDLADHIPLERVDAPFERVVAIAAEVAAFGDAVLLSPACASFDMFRDYEERGRRFKELAGARVEVSHG